MKIRITKQLPVEDMSGRTLEDFQKDPMQAMEQIRELAAGYLSLQRERDAAVQDLESMMFDLRCTSFCLKRNLCVTQNCYMRGTGVTSCRPKWRGPYPEQILAPADQSAGEYADNPVLAQA